MKKCILFALVIVLGTLISCSEDDKPINPLIGTWESRVFVDSLDVWFVETIEIKNDSLYSIAETVRETESGPDLGYRLYVESFYELNGKIFSLGPWNSYTIVRQGSQEPLFVSKSELDPVIVEKVYSSAEVTISSDLRQMDFLPICKGVFEEYCPNIKKFLKVN